jgi:hypothetical protein
MISVAAIVIGYMSLLAIHPVLGAGAIVFHISIMALAGRR